MSTRSWVEHYGQWAGGWVAGLVRIGGRVGLLVWCVSTAKRVWRVEHFWSRAAASGAVQVAAEARASCMDASTEMMCWVGPGEAWAQHLFAEGPRVVFVDLSGVVVVAGT